MSSTVSRRKSATAIGSLCSASRPDSTPGDNEHFVDQRKQMPSSPRDVLDAFRLAGGGNLELEELREAEDRVERRPQLVAHAREEFALRPIGLLRLFAGQPHTLFRALARNRRGEHIGDGLEKIDVVLREFARGAIESNEHAHRLLAGSDLHAHAARDVMPAQRLSDFEAPFRLEVFRDDRFAGHERVAGLAIDSALDGQAQLAETSTGHPALARTVNSMPSSSSSSTEQ